MGRLQRIAEVHGLLTYRGEAPDTIDFTDYLRRLCHELAESLALAPGQVQVEVDAEEDVIWGPDLVVPLGLIVGEALTNAMKHAFPEGREGRVRVELHPKGGGLMALRIEDDGIGMPPKRREGSLGLRLIEMFAQQIKGKAVMEGRSGGDGTMVVVIVPTPTTGPSALSMQLDANGPLDAHIRGTNPSATCITRDHRTPVVLVAGRAFH
jgi:two-component sensor histidine kinase